MADANPSCIAGIYTITSPSGRIYVGQSRHVYRRFAFYRYDKRKGTQPKLDCSFFKYGILAHCFEMAHWLPNNVAQEVLDKYEQIYIDSYRRRGYRLLNCREGGYCGALHSEQVEKIRAKLLGHSVSQETRDKIGRAHLGKKHGPLHAERSGRVWRGRKRGPMSDEHKAKLSKQRIGREPWNKGKTGVYKPEAIEKIKAVRAVQSRIIYTDEIRERMRQAAKKRGISDETRRKINETKRRQAEDRRLQNALLS